MTEVKVTCGWVTRCYRCHQIAAVNLFGRNAIHCGADNGWMPSVVGCVDRGVHGWMSARPVVAAVIV